MVGKPAHNHSTAKNVPWPLRLQAHEEEQPRLTAARGRAEKRHFIAELAPQARRHRFMTG